MLAQLALSSQVEAAWKGEATLDKINRLLHKSGEQMPIFGQICTKKVDFTPDLGYKAASKSQVAPGTGASPACARLVRAAHRKILSPSAAMDRASTGAGRTGSLPQSRIFPIPIPPSCNTVRGRHS